MHPQLRFALCLAAIASLAACAAPQPGRPGAPGTSHFTLSGSATTTVAGAVPSTPNQHCVRLTFDQAASAFTGNATLTWDSPGSTARLTLAVNRDDGRPGPAATGTSPLKIDLAALAPINASSHFPVHFIAGATGDPTAAPTVPVQAVIALELKGQGSGAGVVSDGSCS